MKSAGLLVLLWAVFVVTATAQLWSGSLGDPVVNIGFGEGSNPGPPLPSPQTTLKYVPKSCPSPGEYSLVNLTFACFGNAWHTLSGDHTPADAGGYYMLINSADTRADYFVYSVSNLCPNTRYQLATWFKNALRPSSCDNNGVKPNLKFSIETSAGVVLQTYNTGEIAADENPEWKQYGTTFVTGASSGSLVLRISNAAVSGCGNAFALDDITLQPCGPAINARILNRSETDISVCSSSNEQFILKAFDNNEFTNPQFQWQYLDNGINWKDIAGATNADFIRSSSQVGGYTYRCTLKENSSANECRVATNQLVINVLRPPFVQATNYVYGCLGGDVALQASGATSYKWTGPNGFTTNAESFILPTVQYSDAGLYKVTGLTNLGCSNSDSTFLRVYPNATATSSQGGFICEGAATPLQAAGGIRYQWEPYVGLSSDTIANPIASPARDTRYMVRVTNQFGCSDTAFINIKIWKKPQANAGPDLKTRLGYPVRLQGSASGTDITWSWTPFIGISSAQALTPQVNPPQTTTYRLQVSSPHGCGISTDESIVKVFDKIYIPNAFSPNGDGINDNWNIEPLDLFSDAVTEVYNRNGQLVYRSIGYAQPWNGTRNGSPLPQGTYYYVIDLKANNEPKLTGSITILR